MDAQLDTVCEQAPQFLVATAYVAVAWKRFLPLFYELSPPLVEMVGMGVQLPHDLRHRLVGLRVQPDRL